ncbi:MAG: hypothetical protein L3K03_04165 [Thermoplasmata archaeon]|nr:hypothetical protein [Thermoplasmata archaeon]
MVVSALELSPFAAVMALTTALLVKWGAEAKTPVAAAVVVFLLGMMAAMLGGAAIYFLHPGLPSFLSGLWLASAVMSVSVVPVFLTFLREAKLRLEAGSGYAPTQLRDPRLFVGIVVGLVLANELLMGWAFSLATGTFSAGSLGFNGLASTLVGAIDSPWFLFTMSAEMALTAWLLRDRLPRSVLVLFAVQAGIMFLSPPALGNPAWHEASVYLSSAAMIGLVIFVMEWIYRNKELTVGFSNYTVRLLAVYSVMMAGLFVWAGYGSSLLFALSVVLEMVLYFDAVLSPDRFEKGERFPWQLNARWAFELLAGIFVAELFMGALLDVQIQPQLYLAGLPTLALSGPPLTILTNAASNGFWFLALVTGSTWFLAMMGLEMGTLVVFKFRESRERETKIRLGLMMACYALFVVFFPSLYYNALFPKLPSGTQVPVLGWSMGLGSAPIVPSLFLVILITYVVTGSLSALFGRRVICSTFCSAPLMYQGTTIDSMKSFNRTSPIGRKFLGSRFSTAYSVSTGVVMTSLVGVSFVSYFDQTGALNISVGGTDPSVFLFILSFNVAWYLMFVTIPYTGNYNCVTMGWCYTGTVAQAFQKIGFFKLKVRSKEVCKACTTLDCAKGCPVGLVDMPGHFRTKGEFRSTKCCGVGDCVEACPYGNLYIYDVRHWVRRRFGWPETPARGVSRHDVPLPMVAIARRTTPATVAADGVARPPPPVTASQG